MSSFDDANRRFREDMAAHSKESKKRKLIVLQNADSYINWLNSPSLNSVTRSAMIPRGPRPCHEEKLILKLRQVSPNLKFTKLEASLNEEGSAVIVWLRCSGRHQGNWGKIRPTGKEIIVPAAVLLKIDKNNFQTFSEIEFIFDEVSFFKKVGVDLGDLKVL